MRTTQRRRHVNDSPNELEFDVLGVGQVPAVELGLGETVAVFEEHASRRDPARDLSAAHNEFLPLLNLMSAAETFIRIHYSFRRIVPATDRRGQRWHHPFLARDAHW